MPTVTIFGGSHLKEGGAEYQTARELGKKLAGAGFIVCNGGYGGVMEASARGAKEAGGKTIGITTEDFDGAANRWIDEEIKVKKWSERLLRLIEMGDGYVVLDGGTGTLVELFVVWEMSNKKFICKPIVVFGKKLQDLVDQVRTFPYVINTPYLFFKTKIEDVVNILREKIGNEA